MFRAISAAVTAGVLAAGLLGAPAPAAAATPVCASKTDTKLAARLGKAIQTALRGRSSTTSVALYDRERRMSCYVHSGRRYDSASTIKVTVVAALLLTAQKRGLTAREKSLARAAVTRSDNAATTSLWKQLGRTRLQRFLDRAGLTAKLGPGRYWGLSRISAFDELRLLMLLTRKNDVLTEKSRKYLLGLMSSVVSGQRWGTPAGAPAKLTVHVKNGWLPRSTHGWRVHSLGAFRGTKRDYQLVVLSHDNASMGYGVTSVERVARAVHKILNPAATARIPGGVYRAVPDGSAIPD